MAKRLELMLAAAWLASAAPPPRADTVIRGGTIYDGSGGAPFAGYVALKGDRIVAVGPGDGPSAARIVDARGLAVSPGFVNMLSWATESLFADPRGQSDLRQGVTLEVMGEGNSMGPWNAEMRATEAARQGDIRFPITWTTLGGYLATLEKMGVSMNVASFVGATTARINALGEKDVDPTPEQLGRMRKLVRQAMNEGAMGVASALIYAPASYAETPELIALATEAAKCGGMYISHVRSEARGLIPAIDEAIEIGRASGAPVEIYHMKASGRDNWPKEDVMIARIEAARARGKRVTADMYTYPAASTGLDAAMPTWVQDGGVEAWIARLKDPAIRARVVAEMRKPGVGWENTLIEAGSADNVILVGFKNPALKPLTGKTLAEVAKLRGNSPEETAIDLVIEDGTRVQSIYFTMSEDNVRKQMAIPWISFASDAAANGVDGVFALSSTHPRAFGNFVRVVGKYSRDEKIIPLQEAVRRLSAQPAANLGIRDRGMLKAGNFADVVLFDPATVRDNATFAAPKRYATGVRAVFVNGVEVVKDGEPTGLPAGRFVKGPGAGRCPA